MAPEPTRCPLEGWEKTLLLCVCDGLTLKEIAHGIGKSESALRSRMATICISPVL